MAQKLKVVPESIYKKLLSLNNDTEPEIDLQQQQQESKKSLLEKNELPDDAKLLIYQDIARRLLTSIMEGKKKPLLVKNILDQVVASDPNNQTQLPENQQSPGPPHSGFFTPFATPSSTPRSSPERSPQQQQIVSPMSKLKGPRVKGIVEFLEENGMTYEKDGVILGGMNIKLSEMKGFVGILSNGIRRKVPTGLHGVLNFLKDHNAPLELFPNSVHKYLKQQNQEGGGRGRRSHRWRSALESVCNRWKVY